VDESIDRTPIIVDLLEHRSYLGRNSDVSLDPDRLAATTSNGSDDFARQALHGINPRWSAAQGCFFRPTSECVNCLAAVDAYAYWAHNGYMATKSERFAVRLTAEQDALIRHAAEVEGLDLTSFTVRATVAHARDVLADRRHFVIDDAAWTEFNALLDRPVQFKEALAKMFAKPSIFE
jgi:uncharacterized protein (DUF1778 family)